MNEASTGINTSGKSFPIVAIGASAGGMEAVKELLQNLSPTTGMAYIYIQHLDPTHKSSLTEILGRETEMKVVEATEMVRLVPDAFYIIPPNKEMTVSDGSLTLAPRTADRSRHMPVDLFFTSLAENHKQGAIGVILSGAAHDGAIGLKAIKDAGGITIAQDDTAQFQSMPKAAIAESVVDLVLPPQQIAKELERLGKQANVIQEVMQEDVPPSIQDGDENFMNILQLLKKNIGVDFTHYKANTIKRRMIRRMLLRKLVRLEDYYQLLEEDEKELTCLYQDFLINVTNFFRDPDTLEYLKKIVVPQIIKNKAPNEPIRIWVPACSTGEEAYSLAMIFMEVLGTRAAGTPLQIFATDISELMIAKARLGVYFRSDVANISPKRLQLFFSKIDGSYRIVKTIRDVCVFAPHNIFRDPPFSRIDLVSCCNLMIYLDIVLQKKVLSTFHYALNPSGFLVLGKSENIGSTQLFSLIEKRFRVFSRKNDNNSRSILEANYQYHDVKKTHPPAQPLPKKTGDNIDLEKTVDDVLLQKFVPASVVVNQDMDILQFRGSTGLFLEPMPGRASLNLLKMSRPGLAFELKNAIYKSTKSGEVFKKTGIDFIINDIPHSISIEAVPLKSDGEEKLFLVVFEKSNLSVLKELKTKNSRDEVVKKLSNELQGVREDMRSIIEEQQASNEELQSANEEIVSSNEELQSINEELETSKEELESSNEELMTINTELQIRNEQLAESYEYAEAVFETIREAIVVLDKDRRIKAANTAFFRTFKLTEEQIEGILIYELGNGAWNIPALRELLDYHLIKNNSYNDLKVRWTFPKVGPRILLINGCRVEQKIHQQQIFLLAIQDISDLKDKVEMLIREK